MLVHLHVDQSRRFDSDFAFSNRFSAAGACRRSAHHFIGYKVLLSALQVHWGHRRASVGARLHGGRRFHGERPLVQSNGHD